MINEFIFGDKSIQADVEVGHDNIRVTIGGNSYLIQSLSSGKYEIDLNGKKSTICCVVKDNRSFIDFEGLLLELTIPAEDEATAGNAAGSAGEKDKIFAPMPGKIVKLLVSQGDQVAEKQPLVIVEAMKMEHQINAVAAAVVKKINFGDGDQVDTDTPIIELDIESSES